MALRSQITVGLVTIPVKLEPAVDAEDRDVRTIHTHDDADPARVTTIARCTGCADERSSVFQFTERGREVDGKVVVITSDEMADAEGEPIKHMVPAFHHRDEVYGATVAGDSVQNVMPQKGYELQYVALRNALASHPDIVAVTTWSPRTKNALWVIEVVDNRIVASKRSWPEDVRAVAATPEVDVPDMEQQFFDTLVTGKVTDFDVTNYVNESKAGLEALVSSRLGHAVELGGAAPAATNSGDLLAALQASVDLLAKPKKKPAAKKAAAKRTTTRKVA